MQSYTELCEYHSRINSAIDFVDLDHLDIEELLFRAAFVRQLGQLPEAYDFARSELPEASSPKQRTNTANLTRDQFLAKWQRWQVRRAEQDARDNRY